MRARSALGLVGICAAVSFAYLWVDRSAAEREIVQQVPAIRAGQPTLVMTHETFSGVLRVETGKSVELKSPEWTGLVTSVEAHPDDIVGDGSEIATVDGVSRRIAVTELPFYRSLAQGDEGDDVGQLQQLLLRWGHLDQIPSNPSRFDRHVAEAVGLLAGALGADPATRMFDRNWVVWSPSFDRITIAKSHLRVGEAAPGVGVLIIESTPEIVDYTIEADRGEEAVHLANEWTIQITEEGLRGMEFPADDTAIEKAHLAALIQEAALGDELVLMPDSEYNFTVSAESVWLQEQLSIPVTSLRTSVDGENVCIFVRDSERTPWTAAAVVPLDSPGPNILIDPVPDVANREVLFNPSEALEDPYCR